MVVIRADTRNGLIILPNFRIVVCSVLKLPGCVHVILEYGSRSRLLRLTDTMLLNIHFLVLHRTIRHLAHGQRVILLRPSHILFNIHPVLGVEALVPLRYLAHLFVNFFDVALHGADLVRDADLVTLNFISIQLVS